MAQLPDNRNSQFSLLSMLNPFEWFHFGFLAAKVLLMALKHATFDQMRESIHHMPEDSVPAPAKAVLVVFNAGWLFLIVIVWCLIHALLPFLVFSIAEDLFLFALLVAGVSCSTWLFNRYARGIVGIPAFVRPRTVVVPPQAIGEVLQPEGEGVHVRAPEGVRREGE